MRIENGKLVMERKTCTHCNEGTVPTKVNCPECKGTGNGKRGGKRGCRPCYGMGWKWDQENRQVCTQCKGEYRNAEAETIFDTAPDAIWQQFPFRVVRVQRDMTTNEMLVGHGSVFTCADYGRAIKKTDDEIIADVRNHKNHQACKFATEDGNIAQEIVIVVTPQGYAVYGNMVKAIRGAA